MKFIATFLTAILCQTVAAFASGSFVSGSIVSVQPGYTLSVRKGYECTPHTVTLDADTPGVIAVLLEEPGERIFRPLLRGLRACRGDRYETGQIIMRSNGETLYSANYDIRKFSCCQRLTLDRVKSADLATLGDHSKHWAEYYWASPQEFSTNIDAVTLALASEQPAAYFAIGRFPDGGLRQRHLKQIDGFQSVEHYRQLAIDLGHPPALYKQFQSLVDEWGARGIKAKRKGYDADLLTQDERDELILLSAKLTAQNYWNGARQGRDLSAVGFDFARAWKTVERYGNDATIALMREEATSDRPPTATEITRVFNRAIIEDRCSNMSALLSGALAAASTFEFRMSNDNCIMTGTGIFGTSAPIVIGIARVSDQTCEGRKNKYTCTFTYRLRCYSDTSGQGFGSGVSAGACWSVRSGSGVAQARFERARDGLWDIKNYQTARP